jgi:cytochrome c-type biogenesis protein CcmF
MNFSVNAGNILIIASLIVSLAALGLAAAAASGKEPLAAQSRKLYLLSGAGIGLAALLLLYYFIECDFRFAYVYGNSSRDLPFIYRIAAFWAGKEGSFLLWLLFLNAFGITIARKKDNTSLTVSSVVLLSQIFILVILIIESPFAYIWDKFPEQFSAGAFPADGSGLNPLLKDPWMVAHPPVLFLGYASATLPFGYAIAALIQKEYRDWTKSAYPWLLFSMVTLGIGIFLGGYWAYTVLGWGGYWGWDPVENSSLIPWLAAVALVHGFIVQRRHGGLVRTNILLALLYFILVFYSTWLTRSGVLSNFSVHSFAASEIALFLLVFLLIYVLGAAALFIMRFGTMSGKKLETALLDWKTMAVYGIIVLVTYSLIILIGTSMPLITQWLSERPSNVTTAYYNNFSVPFGSLILALMVLSTTLIIAKREHLLNKETAAALIFSVVLGIALNWGFTKSPAAYIFAILALLLIMRALIDLWKTKSRPPLPSRLAHIGVGLMVLGIVTSSFHTASIQKKLIKGEEIPVDSLRIMFTGFNEGKESYLRFIVKSNSNSREVKTSYYFDDKTESIYKEPYIIAGFINDIYIAPENFESGADTITNAVIAKGEEKEIGGVKVRFLGFRTEHMTSGEPGTYADLQVNGIPLTPGMKFSRGGIRYLDRNIPGTDRSVSLREIDATSKKILINITPGKNTVIPPDSVVITVTKKRLIWLVWAGTILIAAGGSYAYARSISKKA